MKTVIDFLNFRWFVTPRVVKFAFWMGLAGSVVASVQLLLNHRPWIQVISTLLITPLVIRVACELLLGWSQQAEFQQRILMLLEDAEEGVVDEHCD